MRHSVVEAIRRALIEGRFQPGEALSDVALAAEMAISRGPVREALLVLAEEGLVTHQQNRGFFVLRFSRQDAQEVQQVRLPLETLALELARQRLSGSDLRRLDELARDLWQYFDRQDVVESLRCDLEFHQLIWERSENPRLIASLRTLMNPYFAYGSAFRLGRPDLCAALLREQHEMYMEFLRGASTRSAEDCVRFHIYQEPT
jgi:DNA-binding GntR family transcriptional regulator